MDSSTTTSSRKLSGDVRRVVLLPLPMQGHLTPKLLLANILHSKGFSITILHTPFNSPDPTNYPHFDFLSIPIGNDDTPSLMGNIIGFLHYINNDLIDPIRGCLEGLMSDDRGVACLITDPEWFGTQGAADDIKLPRIVHYACAISTFLTFAAVVPMHQNGSLSRFYNAETKSQESVHGLELKVKDLPRFIHSDLERICKMVELMMQGTKQAHGAIWNTFRELESHQLEYLSQEFPNPHFLIGPLHKHFSTPSSSLLTEDQTCLSWLDKHSSNSVLYVSFGSLARVKKSQFLEMAWGLANSKQPFLWVIRPGSIEGSEWLEALPHGFLEKIVEGKGYIVKWAPQIDVLAHPVTGCFWTHSGWNSTMESICEGVPMICSPFFGDQLPCARYVSGVWKIGVQLENGFERKEIASAIKRLMIEEEGLEMRKRITDLKGKANICLKKGGSSYSYVEDLVDYIKSF